MREIRKHLLEPFAENLIDDEAAKIRTTDRSETHCQSKGKASAKAKMVVCLCTYDDDVVLCSNFVYNLTF